MATPDDRRYQRNLQLAMVEANYVKNMVADAIRQFVDDKTEEGKTAGRPFWLKKPLSPVEIRDVVIKYLGDLDRDLTAADVKEIESTS